MCPGIFGMSIFMGHTSLHPWECVHNVAVRWSYLLMLPTHLLTYVYPNVIYIFNV